MIVGRHTDLSGKIMHHRSQESKEERLGEVLDSLYQKYNRRRYVRPDPLQFLYAYPDLRDREIAALVASSLAYGRVARILKSVAVVLDVLGPSPYDYLVGGSFETMRSAFSGFRHRFTAGDDIARMLWAARGLIERHGSLEGFFLSGLDPGHEDILPALSRFARGFQAGDGKRNFLVPRPEKGSACKRWNLFLRWMVRKDDVDPGGWDGIPASLLIVPLDTHMHRICTRLGGTCRKQADMRTALESTRTFRRVCPEDPVKYDFALTRLGIREDTDMEGFFCAIEKMNRE